VEAPARPVSPPARRFAVGETVEVFMGTYWQKATIQGVDGERYKVHYGDRFTRDEAALAIRVRPLNSGLNRTVRVGDRVEVIHLAGDGRAAILPSVVLSVQDSGVTVECEANEEWKHLNHFVKQPTDRMNSSIIRILDR
jgi:hypothetical protein